VQLAGPNPEPPSGAWGPTCGFLTFPGHNTEGFNHPFIPNLSIVALAPHVDNQLTIVGHVQWGLSTEISRAQLKASFHIYRIVLTLSGKYIGNQLIIPSLNSSMVVGLVLSWTLP
jgi:hypothetical protein